MIYHEELDDYKTLTQFKVKGEFKENCFLEPKLRFWIKILESKLWLEWGEKNFKDWQQKSPHFETVNKSEKKSLIQLSTSSFYHTNGQVLRKKVPNINFDLNHIIILIIH